MQILTQSFTYDLPYDFYEAIDASCLKIEAIYHILLENLGQICEFKQHIAQGARYDYGLIIYGKLFLYRFSYCCKIYQNMI